MGQDRAELAIGRIEHALARIESAAAHQAAAPEDGALLKAHEALRSRVREALAQIDGLIAMAERG